jgi:hypothetical protein
LFEAVAAATNAAVSAGGASTSAFMMRPASVDGSAEFLLSARTITTIDVPGATSTEVGGTDVRGDIVGNDVAAGGTHGLPLCRPERE